jgi:hypothetical protein
VPIDFTSMAGYVNLLNPQNVEANRRGEITADQNQRLFMGRWQFDPVVFIQALGMLFLFLGGFLLVLTNGLGVDLWAAAITFLMVGSVFTGMMLILNKGESMLKLWNTFAQLLKHHGKSRAIRQAQGQLAYTKRGYSFGADGRALELPALHDTGGLLPGVRYRVYYLEESEVVLSAEEISPPSPGQVQKALREILATANSFAPEDLEANRNGEVSLSQHLKPLKVATKYFLMTLFLAGCAYWFSISGLELITQITGARLLLFILIFSIPPLVAGICALFCGSITANALFDMFLSIPRQVQGLGHKEKRITGSRRPTTHYYYVVGGQSFEVDYGACAALIDDMEYRVYYLPRTSTLISIEPTDISAATRNFHSDGIEIDRISSL